MTILSNYRGSWVQQANATAGTATATQPVPPGVDQSHYLTLVVATFSLAVVAATTLTVTSGGVTLLLIEIPASVAASPTVPYVIPFPTPFKCKTASSVIATLGSGGTSVVGSVSIFGFISD